jgi:4'-phosphopantetheinyl transferase EntD
MILYGPDGREVRELEGDAEADPALIARCAALLVEMLGPGCAVAVARPAIVTALLPPEEQQFLARSVAKRQAEFGTARLCARRALAQFGIAPGPLLPRADRSPSWPPDLIGSISHMVDCCAVAVARTGTISGLGV